MKTKLTGTTLPVLEVGLEQGDVIVAEPGEFSWMTENVESEDDDDDGRREGIVRRVGTGALRRRPLHD